MAGDQLPLLTEDGIRQFDVAAVYRSYDAGQGAVLMAIDTYKQFWDEPGVRSIGLYLNDAAEVDAVIQSARQAAENRQSVIVRSNLDVQCDQTSASRGRLDPDAAGSTVIRNTRQRRQVVYQCRIERAARHADVNIRLQRIVQPVDDGTAKTLDHYPDPDSRRHCDRQGNDGHCGAAERRSDAGYSEARWCTGKS